MTGNDKQFARNRAVYLKRSTVLEYLETRLDTKEAMALLKYQSSFCDKAVLDLGIGAGRTSRFLAPLAKRYIGIDYSPTMVEHVRGALPEIDVRLGDMRDLSEFPNRSFDFVLASNNVISAVSHPDRLQVLREVARVLRTGGIFVFSAHNRAYSMAGRPPRMALSRNPVSQLRNALVWANSLMHYGRLRREHRVEQEYSLFSDVGHEYSLLHYCIDRPTQARQLNDHGFELLDTFNVGGERLKDWYPPDTSFCLLYVARLTRD